MAKNLANIRIYGGEEGGVWCAPTGTTGPTDLAAPGVGFSEVGWLSENGLDTEQKADQKTFKGWQGGTIVKVSTSGAVRTFAFECLEETAVVLGLVYPGLTFATTTGIARGTVPGGIKTVEKAWVFDAVDSVDGYTKRYVVPLGVVDPSSKASHKFDDMTIYGFTVTVIGDFDIVTDSPSILSA